MSAIFAPGGVTQAVVDSTVLASVPLGRPEPFFGSVVPSANYVFCFGQAISRVTYATLFAVLGTVYGVGNGTTTFNLPDLRGRSVFGKDDMGGSAASRITTATASDGGISNGATLGAAGGEQQHVITINQLAAHSHPVGDEVVVVSTAGTQAVFATTTNDPITTEAVGLSEAHNNLPPAIICNWIMRLT